MRTIDDEVLTIMEIQGSDLNRLNTISIFSGSQSITAYTLLAGFVLHVRFLLPEIDSEVLVYGYHV